MRVFETIKRVLDRIPLYFQQFQTLLRKEGLGTTLKRMFRKVYRFVVSGGDVSRLRKVQYVEWMENVEAQYLNHGSMVMEYEGLKKRPKFSIVFPVWNKSERMLQKALDSVTGQVYEDWELCISDGSTEDTEKTREFLKGFQEKYPEKVQLGFINTDSKINIIENSNNAISMVSGDYIVFMDCDDEISPNCLLELAKEIEKNPKVDFLYSDFDKMDERGRRFDPSFWPDWSPHTLTSQMYTTHITCYRKDVVDKLGGLVEGTEGAQDWDLVLRYVTEYEGVWNVVHIPKVLYHWRVTRGSTALANSGSKDWAYENQKYVLERYLKRRRLKGKVLKGAFEGSWRVKLDIIGNPKVSIVIPTKDKVEYLRRAVESIREHTEYGNYEIVVVNNNSEEEETLGYFKEIEGREGVRVLDFNEPFHFGRLYNWASRQIDGEYMLMLNNDIKVLSDGWLESMLEWVQLSEVGSVGARLYYEDGRIQHAGVIVGAGGAAAHSHRLMDGDSFGYNGAVVNVRNYLALTGACLLVKRKTFIDMGGFDEQFDPAYQDVDLGIRLYERGLYNVYTPYAELIHYESVSRFEDKGLERDEVNAIKLRKKWSKYIYDMGGRDPFYNENLSYRHEDFRLSTI
ncbi:MAG TPA: glycosyltransferase [Candidatus Dojkabacteria bacterium]|nr:glycosyltransferase [Candidatus Dojkabacteria bacterium]